MEKIIIKGPSKISGSINISGSKNASLPILISTILSKGSCLISNIPNLRDTRFLISILSNLGCKLTFENNIVKISNSSIKRKTANYEYVRQMRASIVLLGPVIARYSKFKIALPGGCAIGSRSIDLHLEALQKMGVQINIVNGYVVASRKTNRLNSINHKFSRISVGATQNIVMAATLAKGTSVLENCAIEPEIIDLIEFLIKCGALINISKRKITIKGQLILNLSNHKVIPDRIEAGSYILATMATKGKLIVNNLILSHLKEPIRIFKKMGLQIKKLDINKYMISCKKIKPPSLIETKEYPGFPTDLQAQLISLFLKNGIKTKIKENIFENRFIHIPELRRFGASLDLKGNLVQINKVNHLNGAEVMATDLRGSFSLIIAAMCANGNTTISRIYHLDRGYEDFDLKLKKCSVKIKRINNE